MPRAAETTTERQARLAEIRRRIQDGTYETEALLSAAVDVFLAEFADDADGASTPEFRGPNSLEEQPDPWPRPR